MPTDVEIVEKLRAAFDQAVSGLEPSSELTQNLRRRYVGQRRRRRALVTVGATAVAACMALVGTTFLGGGSSRDIAYAATPPSLHYTLNPDMPSARDLLLELSDKAAAQSDQKGQYDYISTRGVKWSFPSDLRKALQELEKGELVTGVLDSYTSEYWVAADGSGRVEESDAPDTSGPRVAHWLPPLSKLPTDVSAMKSFLAESALSGGRTTAQGIAVIETKQFVDPLSQAAMLRVLAGESGVTDGGTVADRAGRKGVAVNQLSSDGKIRYTLIFDPSTGALLDLETTVLDSSVSVGELTDVDTGRTWPVYVHTPAVTEYIVWLKTGRVDSTDQTP